MNRIITTALALTLAASTAPIAGMAFAQQSTKPLEEQNGTTKKQPESNQSGGSSQNETTEQNGATQKGSAAENSGEASGKAGTGTATATETQTQTKQQQQQKNNDSGTATQQNGQSGTESTKSKSGAATQDNAAGNTEQKSGSETKVNITTEQRTEIRNVIVQEKVEPVSVDIDVSVGVVVPKKKVHLHRLPARIVKLVPAYRGYEFFVLADGRIVIVEPSTYRVVYILTA